MKNVVQKYGSIFLIAAVIVILDQWTKSLVRANLPSGATWLPDSLLWLSPYARIVHWYNTGAAFAFCGDRVYFAARRLVSVPLEAVIGKAGGTP